MDKKTFILFTCILTVFFSKAQPGKESWHWYFGVKCSLDFSSGAPVSGISSSLLNASDGCASISDANTGKYLFSLKGSSVTNKNLLQMSNGTSLDGSNLTNNGLN